MNSEREECISVIKYLAKLCRDYKDYPEIIKGYKEVFLTLIYELDFLPPYVYSDYHSFVKYDKDNLPVSITVRNSDGEIIETIDLLK